MSTGKTLREKIKEVRDINEKVITVKEWEQDILIRGISAGARFNIFLDSDGKPRTEKAASMVQMVIECSYDPKTKEKIFLPEDAEMLLTKNAEAIGYITDEIAELSAMTVKSQEQIEKNFDTGIPEE